MQEKHRATERPKEECSAECPLKCQNPKPDAAAGSLNAAPGAGDLHRSLQHQGRVQKVADVVRPPQTT